MMCELKIKNMCISGILLALGLVLHIAMPPIFGVKPDILLLMLYICILINKDNIGMCIACGILAGILTALTTAVPGGQLPNLIDKTLTSILCCLIIKLFKKEYISMIVMCILSTMFSGFVFLYCAFILAGLQVSIPQAFMAAVIPAVILNTLIAIPMMKIYDKIKK